MNEPRNMAANDTLPRSGAVEQAQPARLSRVLARVNSRLQGYFPALGAFLMAMVVHSTAIVLFGPAISGTFPFFLYLLAFLIAAWCGYGPGLLVTILITCGMPYLFKPNFSIGTSIPQAWRSFCCYP